jgi:hypothetical protein
MQKTISGVLIGMALLVFLVYVLHTNTSVEQQVQSEESYKNAEYVIDGERIVLGDEFQYFGNDFEVDLDNDGQEDVVFLLTQKTEGSGTLYYVVGAFKKEAGYVGSDGYLLGDRITPQSIEMSPNPRHKNVIVVNYTTRAHNEPMTSEPSVDTSVYLKIDSANMMWGIVEPDFEGESR